MLTERFEELHKAWCKDALELSVRKGHDYSTGASEAGQEDTLKNLKMVEILSDGKVSAEIGVLVRMTDKLSRMWQLVFDDAKVKDESVSDTEIDLVNYTLLKRALRIEKKDK